MKRNYRVIVRGSDNKIVVCHLFTEQENAFTCYNEFCIKYAYFNKIIIESFLTY